ncbi:efflux RND transporter permease subunit [Hyphomicrobium sp.]|uniref:efflux RND transporter permease subunit n=1 Tax=Hyphomicrobium sp. TaxID=82 RepID=UPI002E2F2A5D|nr:efflux RND transporter permease subunit [Hyphomicrobium sp.]HEX2842306.1 efflux RND transporter permease subunit [Hyphomicrobium sp.]
MNLSAPFVARPVATTLISAGIALFGIIAFPNLPLALLPEVDFPTILVQAQLPGASPETMASSVAAPLERHLGELAAVSEMTSQSALGTARITLQFDLSRDIDGAARDVQAAINAARADLPSSLRSNPTYRKVNPADFPILIIAVTSDTMTQGQLYDEAATVLQQRLSQVSGVGNVDLGGSALPAVRVELIPSALFKYGIGLEDVRAALASANAHSPKGAIEDGERRFQIESNDQATKAGDYRPLVVAYRNGAPVRLTDVAQVKDSVEDLRNLGLADGKPAVLAIVYRQPGANIINTVDRVKALLPELQKSLPGSVDVTAIMDRTTTIRTALAETGRTLVIAVALVVVVVFIFLRNARATLIPAIAVPISIVGTLGPMYLLGYSLDNLSFMALIVATGFVVDDAIVVVENVSRHMEEGMSRRAAAIEGAREVGFTVLTISVSLIAVFIPILLMGGIVGRIFREFAVVLSIAVLISLVVSLTTTPMMCSRLLPLRRDENPGRFFKAVERGFDRLVGAYARALDTALRHPRLVMVILGLTIALNVALFAVVPKGLFPQTDTGRIIGTIQGDQSISFQAMETKLRQYVAIIRADHAVAHVVGFTGGRQVNGGSIFVALKPIDQRRATADEVIARLRKKMAEVPGASVYLQSVQDIKVGGRQSAALYQYTLQSANPALLFEWADKLTAALQKSGALDDVNSDQQQNGLSTNLTIDRDDASRFGLTANAIDNTLYDAFGQRQVSTIYNPLNQYHVVMEVAPQYWQDPRSLHDIYVSTAPTNASGTQTTNLPAGAVSGRSTGSSTSNAAGNAAAIASDAARNQATNSIGTSGNSIASSGTPVSTSVEKMVPLSAVTRYRQGKASLSVNHQGVLASTTISFNLKPGQSLSDAAALIEHTKNSLGMPAAVTGSFSGTAATFIASLSSEPILIAAALAAVYIVLGILYESYVHPITILSTLPSAGVGAVLSLMICGKEFSVIALIGVILLIGIVKKNAIMMIDFALQAERGGMSSREAIRTACLLRFRPILMTTLAASLGALPLALGTAEGAEMRTPLGISIVGGLMASQLLTLFTTPIVYLYVDEFSQWWAGRREALRTRWGRPPSPAE